MDLATFLVSVTIAGLELAVSAGLQARLILSLGRTVEMTIRPGPT
jgi:hypothetical protein